MFYRVGSSDQSSLLPRENVINYSFALFSQKISGSNQRNGYSEFNSEQ